MCGIIGAVLSSPTDDDLDLVKRVFLESRIRGMHATGISFVKNDKIVTIKESVSADIFLETLNLRDCINEDNNLYLIGHCRYSTSDLEFNQPINSDKISIVHNGVITQQPNELWSKLYGYVTETKNDSELVLRTLEAYKEPLTVWGDSSMAVCELYSDKTLNFYRNGQRPIYYLPKDNGYIIGCTKDIFNRAGANIPLDGIMNIVYNIKNMELNSYSVPTNKKDLQYAL
jgi:glutamine phosphoribosylpyrophosphate amidotransferase